MRVCWPALSVFSSSKDPGSPDAQAKDGKLIFDVGGFWSKRQHIATGQANVKSHGRYLRDLITSDRAREKGWTKVILHPTS